MRGPLCLGAMPGDLRLRRWRQCAALAVLSLHLLGVGLGLRLSAWADRSPPPPRQAALEVRLLRLTLPATPAPPATQAPAAAARQRTPPPLAQRRRPEDTLQAITLPAPATQEAPAVPSAPASAAPAPPQPLNLALPRGASAPWRAARNPAVDDPRSNLGKLTLEQKLADAMGGDGQWVEETIDADRRRLKRGNTCIYLQRPRAAQLDPFNPAYRALPWQAGQPVRC